MRRFVTKIFLLSLAFSFCPLVGFADVVQGRVTDPQGSGIAGTRVVLDCGGIILRTHSKGDGRFAFFNVRASNPCRLTVGYPHFKTLREKVRVKTKPLVLWLRLAPVKESVTVKAHSPDRGMGPFGRVDSSNLSKAELHKVSNNTAQLIAYAKLVAGAGPEPDNIYVDGLPAKVLPPAEMISRITVNADPFSAEYSDGDANHIEITTGSADRKFRYSLGGGSLGFGGGSPLAPGLHSSSHYFSPTVSGPVPNSPLTFSFEGNFGSSLSDQLVQAVLPGGSGAHTTSSIVPNGGSSNSGSLNLLYSRTRSSHAGFSYSQSRNHAWNSGVGGLATAEAGMGTTFGSREVRAFLENNGNRWAWNTGFVFDSTKAQLWANSTAQSVNVPGYFQAEGSAVSDSSTASQTWTWKTVFRTNSQKHFGTWGMTASRAIDDDYEIPNPAGQMKFQDLSSYASAVGGALTGTLIFTEGAGRVRHTTFTASPFVQGELWRSGDSILQGGLRGDYQSGGGVILSPRLSVVTLIDGFILRGGAGLFVHPWPDSVLSRVLLNDGSNLRELILNGAALSGSDPTAPGAAVPLVARISPDLVRPTNIMLKVSVERRMGNLSAGVGYTWVNGTHLLGSRRVGSGTGWTDLLESDRLLRKKEVHVRLHYRWKGQNFVGNYEWVHSRDDTGGPFSFPEFQDNLRAEWARSTGVPASTGSLVGNFSLPLKVSLTLLGSWHSSTPYTILTGRDINGDALFNDRGGRPRNGGNGPAYRSISLYGYRHFSLGRFLPTRDRAVGFDAGIQADDVLGNRNYLSYGAVVGSPLFGRPLAALPGPSVRVWLTFAP